MNPMTSSMQGNVISAVTPPVPPHPPAVPSHKTPVSTAKAVSPPPSDLVATSKEARTKSTSPAVVKPPKDSSPSAKLKNADGDTSGAEVSPTSNIKNG